MEIDTLKRVNKKKAILHNIIRLISDIPKFLFLSRLYLRDIFFNIPARNGLEGE